MKKMHLRELRIQLGYTTKQLADILGCTFKTIYNYENGTTPVSRQVYKLVKNIYHVELIDKNKEKCIKVYVVLRTWSDADGSLNSTSKVFLTLESARNELENIHNELVNKFNNYNYDDDYENGSTYFEFILKDSYDSWITQEIVDIEEREVN